MTLGSSGSSPPAQPSPMETAQTNAMWNQPNVRSPYGAQTWTMDDNGRTGITISESPGNTANREGNENQQRLLAPKVLEAMNQVTTKVAPKTSTDGMWDWDHTLDRTGLAAMPTAAQQTKLDMAGMPEMRGDFGSRYAAASSALGPAYFTGAADLSGVPALRSSIDTTGVNAVNQTLDTSGVGEFQRGAASGGDYRDLDLRGVTRIPGTDDFSADRDQTQQALYRRALQTIQPEQDLARRRTLSDLEARGLPMPGEAWQGEMDRLDRNQFDQRESTLYDAIAAGNAEQGRLFGEGLASRQQGVGERQAGADTHNKNVAARFGENLSNVGVNNDVTSNLYTQALQKLQAENAAQGQAFGQATTKAEFGNKANAQGFQQALADMASKNAAQQQLWSQALGSGQFDNAARAQTMDERVKQMTMENAARQTNFAEGMAARQQGWGEEKDASELANSSRTSAMGERMALTQEWEGLNKDQAALAQIFQTMYGSAAPPPPPFLAPGSVSTGQDRSLDAWAAGNARSAAADGQTMQAIASAAMIAAMAFSSSKDYKEAKAPIDGNSLLERLESLPVEAWRYRDDSPAPDGGRPHIGPYAEDWHEAFGLGDGKTIAHQDIAGVNTAAIKALAAKVRQLEEERGDGPAKRPVPEEANPRMMAAALRKMSGRAPMFAAG